MARKVSNIKVAIIYANAMYEGATLAQEAERMYADAQKLQDVLRQDPALLRQIDNPLWSTDAKDDIITAVAQKMNLCFSMLNSLKVLAENRKINLLPSVLQQFNLIYQEKNNIAEVEVATVIALNQQQEDLLKEKLATVFNKKIVLKYVIAPEIIGGLVLKCGTNLIDNSLKHKLNALEQMMKGNN